MTLLLVIHMMTYECPYDGDDDDYIYEFCCGGDDDNYIHEFVYKTCGCGGDDDDLGVAW